MKHEDVIMFFLRYRPLVEMMVRFGNIPKKETFTDLYNDYLNMNFLQKIRKSIEKLRHLGKSECDMDLFTLYEMAAQIEDELYGGNSATKNNPKHREKQIIGAVTTVKCYYCNRDGHDIKQCRDKRQKKEACSQYIDHFEKVTKRKWVPWADRKAGDKPPHILL